MIGNYPFAYQKNDHQYEGFFPDIPEIKVSAKSIDEINNLAAQKLRIFLSKNACKIPSSSTTNNKETLKQIYEYLIVLLKNIRMKIKESIIKIYYLN